MAISTLLTQDKPRCESVLTDEPAIKRLGRLFGRPIGRPRAAATTWRYEWKYRVPPWSRSAVLADLAPFSQPDDHAGAGGFYSVRSVYLDSVDWSCVHEKADGLFARNKLRLRAYPDERGAVTSVKFEIKSRRGPMIRKQIATLNYAGYRALRSTLGLHVAPDRSILHANPSLAPFYYWKLLHGRVPVCTVVYRRQAFGIRAHPPVRVTFDDHIRGSRHTDVSMASVGQWPVLPFESVLEIKSDAVIPFWLKRVIDKHRLQAMTVSKYVLAVASGPFGVSGIE